MLFGPHIYFARTELARKRFVADPVRHVQQPQAQPRAAQRVVVTGPPKSGKTRFAELVSRELGAELMTAASCVSEVMGEVSGLGKSVRSALYAGKELDEESVSAAVVAACRRRNAWVLDGFPVTPGQAAALEAGEGRDTRKYTMLAGSCVCFVFVLVLLLPADRFDAGESCRGTRGKATPSKDKETAAL